VQSDVQHCGGCDAAACPPHGECDKGACSTGTKRILAGVINSLSSALNLQGYLNNYQTTRDPYDPAFAFYARSSSYISFGAPDPVKNLFDFPPLRFAPWTLYFWGAQSNRITVTTTPQGTLELNIIFAPFKVMTDCVQNILCVGDPNFGMTNTSVVVDLTPTVEDGRLSYAPSPAVKVNFDLTSISGLCQDNLFAFVCDYVKGHKNQLYPAVEKAISNAFDNPNLKDKITAALDCAVRSTLQTQQPFVAATIENGDLVIEYNAFYGNKTCKQ
jgi:hypothetical protein